MHSYNLFWSKIGEGIGLAVPEDHAVPHFVVGSRWSFGGKVGEDGVEPVGFDGDAADAAVRFNGYYLFQSVDARHA